MPSSYLPLLAHAGLFKLKFISGIFRDSLKTWSRLLDSIAVARVKPFWVLPVLAVLALLALAGWLKPDLCAGFFRWCNRVLEFLSRTTTRACLTVILLSALLTTWFALEFRLPEPRFHDEFAYVLAGDTFAHGRWTNPPHPMGRFFETFQVIQKPTYSSKYPPGQGLILALGQVTTGFQLAGVWLCTALACAAVFWVLLAFVPRKWALMGGILTAVNPQVLMWNWSFWGGSLALLGGSLLVGALARLVSNGRTRYGAVMGLGMVLLALSRPFEGVLLSIFAGVYYFVWGFAKGTPGRRLAFFRSLAPMIVILALGAGVICSHNRAVTGNPFLLPYRLHDQVYSAPPAFVFQKAGPVEGDHPPQILRGWAVFRNGVERQQTLKGFFTLLAVKWTVLYQYLWYCLPVVFLPGLVAILRSDRQSRLVAIALAGCFIGMTAGAVWLPHYFAPFLPLLVILVVEAARATLRFDSSGRGFGRFIVPAALLYITLWSIASGWLEANRHNLRHNGEFDAWQYQRADLVSRLEKMGGQHLVLVHYGPDHVFHKEWVYNKADVDGSPVVFAQDDQTEKLPLLFHYYANRRIWMITPDAQPMGLVELFPGK